MLPSDTDTRSSRTNVNPNTRLMGAIKAHIRKNYSFFMRRGRSVGASDRGQWPLTGGVCHSQDRSVEGAIFGLDEHKVGGLEMFLTGFWMDYMTGFFFQGKMFNTVEFSLVL